MQGNSFPPRLAARCPQVTAAGGQGSQGNSAFGHAGLLKPDYVCGSLWKSNLGVDEETRKSLLESWPCNLAKWNQDERSVGNAFMGNSKSRAINGFRPNKKNVDVYCPGMVDTLALSVPLPLAGPSHGTLDRFDLVEDRQSRLFYAGGRYCKTVHHDGIEKHPSGESHRRRLDKG